ncbi:pentapeptide repeat-containing protein [Kitasatospora sp. NPDC057542]|uniref:pentapeptide repeat-containing protein n=1 Tax=Kitasatospora sp. NPDC057542 TaxID=3346162 RepID=UPI0036BB7832
MANSQVTKASVVDGGLLLYLEECWTLPSLCSRCSSWPSWYSFSESWQGCDFDFTHAVFDGGSFKDAEFCGRVKFHGAVFRADDGIEVTFEGAAFRCGCQVEFWGATFAGPRIVFRGAQFTGGSVMFRNAVFEASLVQFDDAHFTGGQVDFSGAQFADGDTEFRQAVFNGATVLFNATYTNATVGFWDTRFDEGQIDFNHAVFGPGHGLVSFGGSSFSEADVRLETATFNGLTVDLSKVDIQGQPPKLPPGQRPGLERPQDA